MIGLKKNSIMNILKENGLMLKKKKKTNRKGKRIRKKNVATRRLLVYFKRRWYISRIYLWKPTYKKW